MLHEALQNQFGHTSFRPGQEAVIQALIAGKSALALFPTGAGKSLCYQLPALLMNGCALVVSPLLALMEDQVQSLTRRGIAAARLDSTLTEMEAQSVMERYRSGALKLLFLSPERLARQDLQAVLRRVRPSFLAIDEAHCIAEWGHSFRPEYLRLAKVAQSLKLRPILALTATATPTIAEQVREAFRISRRNFFQTPFQRPNLFLKVTPLPTDEKVAHVTALLRSAERRPAVVYVTRRETAEHVATHLSRAGLQARAYHAGLPEAQRTEAQSAFILGECEIIVATIAFGMGIDKADIRSVIHYNAPKSLENYQQEIGRAGRDGADAHCEMLPSTSDRVDLENFVLGDLPSPQALQQLAQQLLRLGGEFEVSMYQLSQAHDVRLQTMETILAYFELEDFLEPAGCRHASYQIELLQPEAKILAGYPVKPRQFLTAVLASAKRGRGRLTIAVDEVAVHLGKSPAQIEKALEALADAGDITLKAAGLRQMYRLTSVGQETPPHEGAARLVERFAHREKDDLQRIAAVFDLALSGQCRTRQLLRYFGEKLSAPCGHCDVCTSEALPAAAAMPICSRDLTDGERKAMHELLAERHAPLRSARQFARFLCGMASPATTRERLTRHDCFGLLADLPFRDVLAEVIALVG